MQKLERSLLWSLEEYARQREAFRNQIIEHKKARRIPLGAHANLCFEDFLTMKYQVQEMLRVERIFEAQGIEEEIESYNPLIPDGGNLKATFMIEYEDASERQAALGTMAGVEDTLWVEAEGGVRTFAIANEDLDRSTEDKAAAVHFLRFELDRATVEAFKSGATVRMGIDHPALASVAVLTPEQQSSLAMDLD